MVRTSLRLASKTRSSSPTPVRERSQIASVLGKRTRSEINSTAGSPIAGEYSNSLRSRRTLGTSLRPSLRGKGNNENVPIAAISASDNESRNIRGRKVPRKVLENIVITPPTTPTKTRRLVQTLKYQSGAEKQNLEKPCSNPSTPSRRLFASPLTPCSTPGTPSSPSVYNGVKSIFQRNMGSGKAGRLICRDTERHLVENFFQSHISEGRPGCMYISGPPGTGKSALIGEILADMGEGKLLDVKNGHSIAIANVNCMTLRKPSGVYSKILSLLGDPQLSSASDAEAILKLEGLFSNSNTRKSGVTYVVVLDEMDYLMTKEQDILYRIFEWTKLKNAKLVVIGIANALNLTTRLLPKLKARNFSPELIRFMPYSAEQIANVIRNKISSYMESLPETDADREFVSSLVHPAAIQLCARKTAANSGDLRKAFDICKRGLDLAEEEARKKFCERGVDEISALSSSSTPSLKSLPLIIPPGSQPPKVTIAHIAKICSIAFGGSSVQRVRSLNLHQKAVLCALVLGEKKAKSSLTVRGLFECYEATCANDKLLDSLKSTEFKEVVNALESCGVVSLSGESFSQSSGNSSSGGGSARVADSQRISSNVQEIELLRAVEDVAMLKRFFAR
ncbi:P-loop containing nucleoside triphosphate hydrolase protein [Lipomyces oligophaga]|uniref:P-loop containing nucleoside triphosphate hydrolase protein n=1 Tax=Lipomyces oligophaga TaxID=45792 RepID=UPI0034CEADDD